MVDPNDESRRNLETALAYIEALSQFKSGDALSGFFHDEVVQEEFPSRLVPGGGRHERAALLERSARGATLLRSQRYDVRNSMASGRTVALELEWRGVVKTSLGAIREGQELRAEIAVFLEFEDGRIKRQRNYDCYYPF